jgi:hypothetical protein
MKRLLNWIRKVTGSLKKPPTKTLGGFCFESSIGIEDIPRERIRLIHIISTAVSCGVGLGHGSLEAGLVSFPVIQCAVLLLYYVLFRLMYYTKYCITNQGCIITFAGKKNATLWKDVTMVEARVLYDNKGELIIHTVHGDRYILHYIPHVKEVYDLTINYIARGNIPERYILH